MKLYFSIAFISSKKIFKKKLKIKYLKFLNSNYAYYELTQLKIYYKKNKK